MTTYESTMTWVARASAKAAQKAAANSARRTHATPWVQKLWSLLLVLGGLGAFTYAAWLVAHPFGLAVGGICAFVLRSLVSWGPDESP